MACQRSQKEQVASAAHTSCTSLQETSIKKYFQIRQPARHTIALQRLQQALENCSSAETEADDPSHLKVPLMPHQKHALALLLWREEQHPCGGILVDKAGLGYILTMISLVLLKIQEAKAARKAQKGSEENEDLIQSSCTLVICRASLMDQWAKEVERSCEPGQLNIYLYRGPNREISPEKLAKYDMVFTSYSQVRSDLKDVKGVEAVKDNEASTGSKNQPALPRVSWDRIILDKAHKIKNHKSQTAIATCRLEARARWAVTGYPIQNNTMELFSLIRFLGFTPFDEYLVWKRQVENAGSTKSETLRTLVKSLLLQRTEDQKTSSGNPIVPLPIELSREGRKNYDQLFQQFRCTSYKLVNQLRLRQCCDHLSLPKELTDGYPPSFLSTKINLVINGLKKIRAAGPADRPMKSIVLSQWTRMLDVVASHLEKAGFKYWSIRGGDQPKKRVEAMEDFNNNPRGCEVMLVSMMAHGDGLNFIKGNHIFFLDMPWNPVVEDQVCDWIDRAGQMGSVIKFVCSNTIEETILQRQTQKRQLANDVLSGSKSKKVKRTVRQI